jgi:hypothetical protein
MEQSFLNRDVLFTVFAGKSWAKYPCSLRDGSVNNIVSVKDDHY